MNTTELANLLRETKGATFATLVTSVEPKMRKTGNPYYGLIRKVSRVNGVVNWHYANSVNNQRAREGKETDFEALPRAWGAREANSPLVSHKDKLYLELKIERVYDSEYTYNGLPIDAEKIREFLPERKESERQGTDKAIILRDYSLDSIRQITLRGETHNISS